MSDVRYVDWNMLNALYHSGALPKLITFSVTLAIAPISSYFLSEKYIWNGQYANQLPLSKSTRAEDWTGNPTYAAITAIVTANAVLIAYIIASIREDKQESAPITPAPLSESKKTK